jgi:hypothetical protein
MNDSGKSAELTKVEAVVQSNLFPAEKLLRICQERDIRRDMVLNLISLGTFYAGLNMVMMTYIDNIFIPTTWKSVFWLLTQVIVIAFWITIGLDLRKPSSVQNDCSLGISPATAVLQASENIMPKRGKCCVLVG